MIAAAGALSTYGASAQDQLTTARYLVTLKAAGDAASVTRGLASLTETISPFSARVLLVETKQSAALQNYLKGDDKVVLVQPWRAPTLEPIEPPGTVPFNLNSQLTHNVPGLKSKYPGLSGKGVTVGLWDGGPVLASHAEFDDRIHLRVGGQPDGHATHVAGTIAARGNPQADAAGMAPGATILSFGIADSSGRPTDLPMMEQVFASATPPQVTNHSYNMDRGWSVSEHGWCWCGNTAVSPKEDHFFGKYDARSMSIDDLAARFPDVTMFVAAGNARGPKRDPNKALFFSGNYWVPNLEAWVNTLPYPPLNDQHQGGYDTLEGFAVAKNVIAVGAIKDAPLNRIKTTPDLVQVTAFSSWGPTDDGRIKPDLVANGANVRSTWVEKQGAGFNPHGYIWKDGTSQATPAATGIGALLTELSRIKRNKALRSDEMKAALIHTAVSPYAGPSYQIGWGAIDAEKAGALVAGDEGRLLTAGLPQAAPYRLRATPTGGALRVSLVWIDPAASPNVRGLNDRTDTLVLDLDLTLRDPAGTPHYPWSLDPNDPDAAATRKEANRRDNVERIDVAGAVAAGEWTIEVAGPTKAAGHGFALAITGLEPK